MKKNGQIFMLIIAMAISIVYTANAQLGINTDGSDPDASAGLDVDFQDKGFLPPRMTTSQMTAISSPANGLTVYNTDVNTLCVYNGSEWDCMDSQSLFNKTFICGDNLRDFRDGQSYSTVQIGTQCWMAENINIGTMINGSSNQTNNGTIDKYCYSNNTGNCDTYGGLYQWYEAMQYVTTAGSQGICPSGWHLPTDDEYKTVEMQLGMSSSEANNTGYRGTDEGSKLAGNEPLWINGNLDQNANFGASGFDALPAGLLSLGGSFNYLSSVTYLWSSSGIGNNALYRKLFYNNSQTGRNYLGKTFGLSVHCVRD